MERLFKSETALRHIESIRQFLISDKWIAILFASSLLIGCLSSAFPGKQIEIYGTVFLAYLTGFAFLFSGDILTMLTPFMFTYIIAIRCYNSLNTFMEIIWLAIPLVLVIIFNLALYGVKPSFKGSQTIPMLFVSVAVLLGGIGFISTKEYFAGASIYHMLGMGFAMVLVYGFFYAKINVNKEYSLIDRISKLMVIICVLGTILILMHYIFNIEKAIDKGGIFFIRWRNNLSTILMMGMPFAFFKAHKKTPYIFLGFFFYIGMLFAGSRGGMVFGAIELIMCLVMFFLYDKKRRLAYAIICICIGFAALILMPQVLSFFSNTLERLFKVLNQFLFPVGDPEELETRVKHYARGVEDFFNRPIFGTGLGYMGNRDIFDNKEGSMCWYHCEPIQIAASFGVVGIVAFIYQFIKRNTLIWKKATLFNMTIFLSYISLEMMSLVNPGILCPVPYLMLITLFLVIVEKCNEGETQEKIPILHVIRHKIKKRK